MKCTRRARLGRCPLRQAKAVVLPDPAPNLSVEDVRAVYAHQYPDIATAAITGPEAVGDKLRYLFSRAIGSKG